MILGADDGISADRAAGHGHLEVQMVYGQSTAVTAWATNPLKLLTPCSRGKSVWAYVSSFGGGVVAGDQNDLTLKLGVDTRCYVSTQASTKVYRNPNNRPSGQRLNALLAAGSLLVLAPDPVQAFADSTYLQEQEFHLETGASLAMVDWCCSGREARGERWAFGNFQSRNEIFIGKERIFIDSLLLDPGDGSLMDPARLGQFNSMAMLIFTGPLLADNARRLLEEINNRPVTLKSSVICSASPVREGVILRVAAVSVEAMGHELLQHLQPLAELLGDDPWARKW